jgi:hypothetical protein
MGAEMGVQSLARVSVKAAEVAVPATFALVGNLPATVNWLPVAVAVAVHGATANAVAPVVD